MPTLANPLPPVLPSPLHHYHDSRLRTHLVFFLVFCALPFLNIIRVDIPRQRFYFAGFEVQISEFAIAFFTLMFLMFVIAGISMMYGRVYCAYACPQMIFSETANRVEERIRKYITKHFIQWPVKRRALVARVAFYALLLIASVFVSFVFISYFLDPRDLLRRLLTLDFKTAGGIGGAATTLVAFVDFAFIRQRFCTSICPYGYLQGMLADKHTLLVRYDDPDHVCIECKKCERVCHMGIDIRKSPFQIECIHCGECVDACDEILGRLKKPGLIHYAWGEHGEIFGAGNRPWFYKLGLRDAKRVFVMLVLTFYASGLVIALSVRHPVMVRISPDRATLYTKAPNGDVINKFKVSISNRSRDEASVELSLDHLPGARLVMTQNPLRLKAGETTVTGIEVVATPGAAAADVSHFEFVEKSGGRTSKIPMTFIMPQQGSAP